MPKDHFNSNRYCLAQFTLAAGLLICTHGARADADDQADQSRVPGSLILSW